MSTPARPYRCPTDSTEEEWAFVTPDIKLLPLDASQRQHNQRLLSMRYAGGCAVAAPVGRRYALYDQVQRWISAGVFEGMVHDLCAVLRHAQAVQAAKGNSIEMGYVD